MATLQYQTEDGWASLVGVTRCNSPWSCPTCAPKVAAARAETLKPQVAALMGRGYSAYGLTLTVRHDKAQPLAELWDVLKKAWGRVTSGREWQDVRDVGAPEYVRGLDLTWSEQHGWHPHVHCTLFLPPAHEDGEAVAKALVARWMKVLGKVGWMALPRAQHVQRLDNPEAAAAYAVTPAAVYEAVALAKKRAHGKGAGLTPFELLAEAVDQVESNWIHVGAMPRCVVKWREYVKDTKGRRQVTVSRGLTLKEPVEDEDEVAGEDEDIEAVADLGPATVLELDRRRLTAPLLDAVENLGFLVGPAERREVVRGILLSLAARDWCIAGAGADLPPMNFSAPGWEAGPPPQPPPKTQPRRKREQADAYAAWAAAR